MSRELSDIIIVAIGALSLFVALPWLILHHARRWKDQDRLNEQNRRLIAELNERAQRLDERAATLERIAAVDEDTDFDAASGRGAGRKK